MRLPVTESQRKAADELGREFIDMEFAGYDKFEEASVSKMPETVELARSQNVAKRVEPLCSGSSALAVGIVFNENLRGLTREKTRRNDMTKLSVSPSRRRRRRASRRLATQTFPMTSDADRAEALAARVGRREIWRVQGMWTIHFAAIHICENAIVCRRRLS